MLDLRLIRRDPEQVKQALARRDPALAGAVDEILGLDQQWRAATSSAEELRAKQKEAAGQVAAAKRSGQDATELLEASKQMSAQVKALVEQAEVARARLDDSLTRLPNLPDPTAASGPEDEVVRLVGEPRSLDFEPRDHLDLAGPLIDMERGAKLSGARFAYLKGALVMLELALVRYALEKLQSHGFTPVIPPVLVRERALYGTGFLPDTEQQIYTLDQDELYLVGTSEVALASLHDGEVIDVDRLPLRYAGFSPCFRREAGAAGKDTRGIFRVHQFDKVEMFSFVPPEDSPAEHERILSIEEEILSELGLPYRVLNIAVNDLGGSAAKKFDCEAWMPSQGRYRELTSCSNTTDYQARRLEIRMRPAGGSPQTLHTLNGTAVAVGRTIVALLENGQQQDGSVLLPGRLAAFGAPKSLPVA
ncbi:MAG TPA: serine--tRNA ligase [Solirubrobacteraceae bacterium]|jgi:seryl-tRNA synthetase|nr:serine--tRNA ligase [Solirubrobacteraceae bacterium]